MGQTGFLSISPQITADFPCSLLLWGGGWKVSFRKGLLCNAVPRLITGLWIVSLRNRHLSRDRQRNTYEFCELSMICRWRGVEWERLRKKISRRGNSILKVPEHVYHNESIEGRSGTGCATEGRLQRPVGRRIVLFFSISRVLRCCEVKVGAILAKLHFRRIALSSWSRTG